MQFPPEKLWFRRKLYGWGWTPTTWEGWAVLLVYVLLLYVPFFVVDLSTVPLQDVTVRFGFHFVVITALMIWVCYKKGEKPRWQWGKDLGDKK